MRVYRVPFAPAAAGWTACVSELTFTPDARRLAVIESHSIQLTRKHQAVRWLELATGEVARTLPIQLAQAAQLANAAALSPDHSLVGLGRQQIREGMLSVNIERYELPNPYPALSWEIAGYMPRSAACVPDGSGFAIALDSMESHRQPGGEPLYAVCGWDGRSGTQVGPVELSWWSAASLAFSPDGRWLTCARQGGRVIVLGWPGGERVGEFHAPVTECIRFAASRPPLAVVATKAVVVYDVPAVLQRAVKREVPRLATLQRGHGAPVNDVVFSPTADQLLTCSVDETARVWELAKRRCVRCFEWGIGPLTAVAWSSDGLLCAAAGADGQIVVWDADV